MSLPDAALLEALSLAELRDLVGVPVAEVGRLRSDNMALRAANETLQEAITVAWTAQRRPQEDTA